MIMGATVLFGLPALGAVCPIQVELTSLCVFSRAGLLQEFIPYTPFGVKPDRIRNTLRAVQGHGCSLGEDRRTVV